MLTSALNNKRTPKLIYTFKCLGSIGGTFTYGQGINNKAQIVGTAYLKGDIEQHAFIANQESMLDIGSFFHGYNSAAYDINDNGVIVGNYSKKTKAVSSKSNQAFLYDTKNLNIISLGALGGLCSFAYSINKHEQVVGYATTATGEKHAFLFDPHTHTAMQDIGTLGGLNSVAHAINDHGQIVGYSAINASETHAFIYANGKMRSLGTLGGACSFAYSINKKGQVVGSSFDANGNERAFIYDACNRPCMQDLGTLGGQISVANDINNRGQIVGYSFIKGDTDARAFLYHNDFMIDLNDVLDRKSKEDGWILNEALAINDGGCIVGIAYNHKEDIPSCAFSLSIDIKASLSYIKFLEKLGLHIGAKN